MSNKCTIPKTYTIVKPLEIENYLKDTLSINLNDHLEFSKSATLKTFALVPPLLVLYHYAKAVGFKLEVRDMMASGHLSHCMGSEMDFRRSPATKGKKVEHQAPIVADLLKLRSKIKSKVDSFRLGFYFDYFKTTKHATDYSSFLKAYKGESLSAIHFGFTYRWSYALAVAKYAPISSSPAPFAFWGQGTKGYFKTRFWEKKFTKDFKKNGRYIGHLNDQKLVELFDAILASFKNLELAIRYNQIFTGFGIDYYYDLYLLNQPEPTPIQPL